MKLHRTDAQPQWQLVPESDQNRWQRLAVATGGYLTPGNAMTIVGLTLVGYGLVAAASQDYILSAGLLVVGRTCDLLDGWLAEYTGTKSPLGETFDAAVDKIGTGAIVVVLGVVGLAPWWLLIATLAPHVIIGLLVVIAQQRGVRLHPSSLGKISMAVAWIGLIGIVVMPVLTYVLPLGWFVYGLLLLSAVMAIVSAFGYGRTVFAK